MLIFEPDRVAYDPSDCLLRLFATDGLMLVRCAVSKAALAALGDDALAGPEAMIETYRRNAERLQEIASRKYQKRLWENGGIVVVRFEDVTNLQNAQGQPVAAAASFQLPPQEVN
jgi:hypothetical protein